MDMKNSKKKLWCQIMEKTKKAYIDDIDEEYMILKMK